MHEQYGYGQQVVGTQSLGVTYGEHRHVGIQNVGMHETVEQMVEMVPRTHQVKHQHMIQESVVEVPQVHTVEKVVQVPRIVTEERVVHIPRVQTVERVEQIQVPEIQTVERVQEVVHTQEVVRHVDVPVPHIQEVVRHVP